MWDETTLRLRGLDALLAEYHNTKDLKRRAGLDQFFERCMPAECQPSDRDLFAASLDDLWAAGRVTLLRAASSRKALLPWIVFPDFDILLFDLHDAMLLPNQTLIVDNLYVSDLIRHMHFNWIETGDGLELENVKNVNPSNRSFLLSLPEGSIKLSGKHVHFLFHGFYGAINFGHFLFDMMAQLIVYDSLRLKYGDLLVPIITHPHPSTLRWPGMEWLFSKLVDVSDSIIHVRAGTKVEVKRAFTSNRMAQLHWNGISVQAIEYLRGRIFEQIKPSAVRPRLKRLYISRKDANYLPSHADPNYREGENIAEVEKVLSEYGFETVIIANETPQKVFDLMYDAEVIVGMHGSGIMYHMYANGPAALVELSYPGYEWDIILACAAACGHKPFRVGYKGNDIDLDSLLMILNQLT